ISVLGALFCQRGRVAREVPPAASARARIHGCARSPARRCGGVRANTVWPVPRRLFFTDSDEANALIATDPTALLIGFVHDQQVTVQQAFIGPLRLRERLGSIDPATLADSDLEPVFRAKPAIHRFPGSMARRVNELAVHVCDRYQCDAARVWRDAPNA